MTNLNSQETIIRTVTITIHVNNSGESAETVTDTVDLPVIHRHLLSLKACSLFDEIEMVRKNNPQYLKDFLNCSSVAQRLKRFIRHIPA